jgi:4-aminobutyrate aminotransferase
VPDIHHVPYPRGPEVSDSVRAWLAEKSRGNGTPAALSSSSHLGRRFVEQIEETIFKRIAPPEEVAAIFVEPIQGESGYHVPPPDFLPALRQLCDRYGILLVTDEVQCGMGRTGKLFAVEHWGVEPDIICLAKGIASGMPLGAMIAKDEVMDWPPGSHASTFGGNPVSCRASLATLDLLQMGYTANAAQRGEQLRQGLLRLQRQHPEIADVRGLGLMVAIELAKDREGHTPDHDLRDQVVQTAFHQGLLLLGAGESAIRFCPPLCITAEQVDTALRILNTVLAGLKPARVAV